MRLSFETERLFVSPMSAAHVGMIFELLNSEGWITNIGDRKIKTTDDAAAYIARINGNPNYSYLVCSVKDSGEPIGIVTLVKRDSLDDADIGFAMLPAYHKSGYSYEASRQYLDLIIVSGNYERIAAITIPQNTGSIRLLEKLGLTYQSEQMEGETKLLVYAMTLPKQSGQ